MLGGQYTSITMAFQAQDFYFCIFLISLYSFYVFIFLMRSIIDCAKNEFLRLEKSNPMADNFALKHIIFRRVMQVSIVLV